MKQFTCAALLAFLSILCFQSCKSPSKYARNSWKNIETVPDDLDTSRQILLVCEMPRLRNPEQRNESVTRKLDKAMKTWSTFRYEIVTMNDITGNPGKYSDTSIYKYAIVHTLTSHEHGHTTTTTTSSGNRMSVSPTATTTMIGFSFYDRVSHTRYPRSAKPTSSINFTLAAFFATVREHEKVKANSITKK